jgi:hypothetical protein
MLRAFEEWDRTDPAPAHHGEPLSTFLDRVAQPLFERVRRLINDWVAALPDDAEADLVARLRSPLDHAFRAAFWELYVHQALVRCGFDVVVHPGVDGTLKVPDFLATRGEAKFYVEATAAASSDAERSGDARRARLHDELNKTESPNFFLWLDIETEGDADPSLKQVRSDLERWLSSLDPDEVTTRIGSSGAVDAMPRFMWEGGGWMLTIGAYPKSVSARGALSLRPLGIYNSGAEMIDDRTPLLRRMKRKSSRYGSLDAPFVLAISGFTFATDEQDVVDALFGSEQVTIAMPPDGGEPIVRPTRSHDGLWIRQGGAGSTQISAVLFVPYIEPWEVAAKVPVLIHHPAAALPLALDCPYLRIGSVDDAGRLAWRDPEQPIADLFELPGDWPGPEPPFIEDAN